MGANQVIKERVLAAADRYPGNSPTWIARKIGVSKSAAYYHMTVGGYWPTRDSLAGGRGNPFTAFEDARIETMSTAGINTYEIGRAIGRAESSVRMRLNYLASRENA